MDFHIFMVGFCPIGPASLEDFTCLTTPNFDLKLLGYHSLPNFEGKYRTLSGHVCSHVPHDTGIHLS